MENNKIITGIIKNNNDELYFSINNFKVVLFRNSDSNIESKVFADKAGYIWGITSEGKEIAIYVGQDFYCGKSRIINTWNYIICKYGTGSSGIRKISGIRFENGVVGSVFPCNALHENRDIETELRNKGMGNWFVYGPENDNKEFEVIDKDDRKVKWLFNSLITVGEKEIRNSDARLDILFSREIDLFDFYNYYGYVSSLFEFLTFRKDVYFDSVSLLSKYSVDNYIEIAVSYNKISETVVSRSFVNSISIHYLSDEEFGNIIRNIVFEDDEKMYLPTNILPKDEKELNIISPEKIQSICAALEAEINISKISLSKEESLDELKSKIKDVVKAHQKSENALPEKTYNVIYGSIRFWGDSLSDRLKYIWEFHFDEIEPLFSIYNIDIKMIDIDSFVKKRNGITHCGFKELTENDFYTAFVLTAVLYCLTLNRIGMDSKKIRDLMCKRIIG